MFLHNIVYVQKNLFISKLNQKITNHLIIQAVIQLLIPLNNKLIKYSTN